MLKVLDNSDLGKLILRLTVGGLILFHGIDKIFNWSGTLAWMGKLLAKHGLPEFFAYGVLVGEVIAPIMLIIGYYSRVAGLLVVGNMVVALYLVHTSQFFTLGNGGGWALELQGFFLLTALAVSLLGAGKYSINRG